MGPVKLHEPYGECDLGPTDRVGHPFFSKEHSVTVNTRGRLSRGSSPLWARGQDAFLIFRRSQDRSQLAPLYTCEVDLG